MVEAESDRLPNIDCLLGSSGNMVGRRVVDQCERRDAQKVRREGEARASPRASPKDTESATARQSLVKEKRCTEHTCFQPKDVCSAEPFHQLQTGASAHRRELGSRLDFRPKRCLFRRAISSAANRCACSTGASLAPPWSHSAVSMMHIATCSGKCKKDLARQKGRSSSKKSKANKKMKKYEERLVSRVTELKQANKLVETNEKTIQELE